MHRRTVGNYIAFGIHIISTQKRLSSDKKPTLSSPVTRNALTFGFKMAEVDTLILHTRRYQASGYEKPASRDIAPSWTIPGLSRLLLKVCKTNELHLLEFKRNRAGMYMRHDCIISGCRAPSDVYLADNGRHGELHHYICVQVGGQASTTPPTSTRCPGLRLGDGRRLKGNSECLARTCCVPSSQVPTRISFQYVTVQGPSIQPCTIPDEGVGGYE
ncbi:hypothetical protein C8Q74DRAFT_752805 [Fomes fomentarius]|nr:hypothetical protein C8Q74DRAFT_752805 [Fomes fomentarius]